MEIFTKALQFASVKHQNQRRKNGDIPYINHPIEVAHILVQAGVKDHDILAAGLLHDTIEDTETTEAELDLEFGARIKGIVLECSDNKDLAKDERKRVQIQKAVKASTEAKLVKMADKISNNRGLLVGAPPSWSKERIQGYFIWSQAVCANLKGTNEYLDKEIDAVFDKAGINSISQEEKAKLLEVYYHSLLQSSEK
jgi:(p)ppGpp synthase/HD superfamily hydrolase